MTTVKLRNLIAAAGILASLSIAGAASAATVTIQLNSLNPIFVSSTNTFSAGPDATFTTSGANTALYEFDLGSAMTVTDASFTNSTGLFTFSSIKLYSGYGNSTTALVEPYTLVPSAHPGHAVSSGSLDELVLAAGKYTIEVAGTTASSVSAVKPTTLGSSIAFSAGVPEPASWAMMIAGLGCIGITLRARKSATAVA
jgi:hypothetical protein